MFRDLADVMRRLNARGDASWSTRDEIAFIVGLGAHRNGSAHQPLTDRIEVPDRQTLLRNYLKAGAHRKDWGEMDRMACFEMAASLLSAEREKAPHRNREPLGNVM